VTTMDTPVTLLARAGLPAVPELAAAGVRRFSTGSSLYRLAPAAASAAVDVEGVPGDLAELLREPR
jgi:2-methylisocitrate lyase-like PEP mutase family enzyme